MKFYLAESTVSKGTKGLFAGSDIKEGTVLFIDHEMLSKQRTKFFEADYRQSEQSRMINHSPNSNTGLRLSDRDHKIERLALKDIRKDEELTGDDLQLKAIIKTLGYN